MIPDRKEIDEVSPTITSSLSAWRPIWTQEGEPEQSPTVLLTEEAAQSSEDPGG